MKELIPQEVVERRIFVIHRQKVMLDRDLAELYGVETRVLNQAVRRNIKRFPEDFMFSLTREEILNLSQIVISSKIKHAPNVFAFTEQGVAMLSSVLNSERAIQVNIAIMRAFVRLKQFLATHKELAEKLKELEGEVGKHNKLIIEIFEIIKQLTPTLMPPIKPKPQIGFHQDPKWAYKTKSRI
ncbi:MAG: ORF6N domain-containing protein [Candidatus Omnitrophota bacterium]|nr:ORF6N domain-containing protein [Candidatus Omnitrophota bacterium]